MEKPKESRNANLGFFVNNKIIYFQINIDIFYFGFDYFFWYICIVEPIKKYLYVKSNKNKVISK